ncbi:unnamed protein product [Protopolystoma xenopodis]|uniref:Uncharacterized protein n=1 Tax=Protopolystoma xenopodis TaxID=117903 RepID=A0A3S5AIC2_9PLAT|nr:unnamed protein product [Protopolystoma xenopodis]
MVTNDRLSNDNRSFQRKRERPTGNEGVVDCFGGKEEVMEEEPNQIVHGLMRAFSPCPTPLCSVRRQNRCLDRRTLPLYLSTDPYCTTLKVTCPEYFASRGVQFWVNQVFYQVPGVPNPVLWGRLSHGEIFEGQRLWLGPDPVSLCLFLLFSLAQPLFEI